MKYAQDQIGITIGVTLFFMRDEQMHFSFKTKRKTFLGIYFKSEYFINLLNIEKWL